MRRGEPSRTAFGAAAHRALHQDLEGGRIFHDPLAWPILGAEREWALAREAENPRRPLRLFIAVRHRFAEDSAAAAYERGVRQAVVLGAGLDTFGYRNPHQDLVVWEVDHPDTGAWKRERVADGGIDVPEGVRYVGVDFERDDLLRRLAAGGVDLTRPAVFLWLGVVPYLTGGAIESTLRAVASVPDAEVVFDYPATDASDDDAEVRRLREDLRRRTEAAGEPVLSTFETGELARLLHDLGFGEVEDMGREDFVPRYFGVPARSGGSGGGRVVRARR